jgi:glycosyltransferase involved in cell wall biosynthesis
VKILFVVPYVPTLIRTRPYNFMRGLVKRGHTVGLVTLWQRQDECAMLRQIERDGVRVLSEHLTRTQTMRNTMRAVLSNRPLQSDFCWYPSLASRAKEMLKHSNGCDCVPFDVVHVEHLRGVRYALELRSLAPTVWDSVDCISYLFEQAGHNSASRFARGMARFELDRTRRYERWLVKQFDRVLVTSATDRLAFERLTASDKKTLGNHHEAESNQCPTHDAAAPPGNVSVVPNGVDLDYFQPPVTPRHTNTLVLSGKMSYHANVTAALHFVREILPLIWKERPQTKLWIVGQSPPVSIKELSADSRIIVTGYVPDVRPYLRQATVAVCPLVYGAGIQNKVLEAMACATPVVCRPIGLNALQACAGKDVLAAAEPQDFARQVLTLLNNPARADEIGFAGRQFVERHHSWSSVIVQLENSYDEVMDLWNSRRR